MRGPAAVLLLALPACGGFGGGGGGSGRDDDAPGDGSGAWQTPPDTPGEEPGDAGGGGGTPDTGSPCEPGLDPVHPLPGATGVHAGSSVWVVVDAPLGDEAILLRDAAGNAVPGSPRWSGDALGFRPVPPLVPNRSYTVEVWACGEQAETWNFRTGDAGTGLDGCEAGDQTFVLDLNHALWVDPPGIDDVLLGTFTTPVQVSLDLSQPTAPVAHIGGAAEGTPAECVPATAHAAGFADGHLWMSPLDRRIALGHATIEVQDMNFAGDLTRDCSTLVGGRLTGTLDTRQIVPELDGAYGIDSPTALCEALIGLQVRCEDCGDGSPTCIPLEVEQLGGTASPGVLALRTPPEVAADPECVDTGGCSHAPPAGGLLALVLLALARRQTRVSQSP